MKKIIIILGIFIAGLIGFVIGETIHQNSSQEEESSTAETNSVESVSVTEPVIDLGSYDANILLEQPGEYTLSGNFNHKIIVRTNSESEDFFTLYLDGVEINNSDGAIVGEAPLLNIISINRSKNTLISYGECEGTLFAKETLAIGGDGYLTVWNQHAGNGGVAIKSKYANINGGELVAIGGSSSTGAGISTSDKYTISGGDVTLTGMDMLEPLLMNTEFRSLNFSLDKVYGAGSIIKVLNSSGSRVGYFVAKSDFRTIVISNSLIKSGKYTLYIDDTEITTMDAK